MANIALIVPAYGHWDYVKYTVESFFEHTPGDNRCYVVDDCSPDWSTVDWSTWLPHVIVPAVVDRKTLYNSRPADIKPNAHGDEKILCYHFTTHYGLTRSWNYGLRLGARSPYWGADYIICGNSDILFTPGWHEPLIEALSVAKLVGPITNASGRVVQQNIRRFMRGYQLSDDTEYLANVAQRLRERYQGRIGQTWRINGFFMMASTATWWENAFDTDHVFDPREKMDNAAYELQKRWRDKDLPIALVPSSFIWHYRSVSRGRRGLTGSCGRGAFRHKKSKD